MDSFYTLFSNAFWQLAQFFAKLAPVPSNVPIPPIQPPALDKIAEIIFNYSKGVFAKVGSNRITVPAKNVIMTQVTQAQANDAAAQLEAGSQDHNIDIYTAMGCIAIESTFDPNCQNGNTGPGESNPSNNPMGYDMGACQLKLGEIKAPGVVGWATAHAFAFDTSKCYAYFFDLMDGYLEDAKDLIASYTPPEGQPHPDPKFIQYPILLATGIYNFGPTGMKEDYFVKGLFPSHCQDVIDLANSFATQDGQPETFPGLSVNK